MYVGLVFKEIGSYLDQDKSRTRNVRCIILQ